MKTPDTVAYVDAIFGGERHRFELGARARPDLMNPSISPLEKHTGSAIYELFGRLRSGTWRTGDVHGVLFFAAPPRLRGPFWPLSNDRSEIKAVLEENGIGPYAPLALQILTAELYRIPIKEAFFDESAILQSLQADDEAA